MSSALSVADNLPKEEGGQAMRQELERRRQHPRDHATHDVETDKAEHAPTLNALRNEMDEILDEIDEVLEENAEEFVTGYVQKGGQ